MSGLGEANMSGLTLKNPELDNYFYRNALEHAEQVEKAEKHGEAWLHSLAARCYFAVDIIASIAYLPIATGGVLWEVLKSWWKDAPESREYGSKFYTKLDHILHDLVGAFISPKFSYSGREEDYLRPTIGWICLGAAVTAYYLFIVVCLYLISNIVLVILSIPFK